jgi:hypothetical protein
MAEIDLARRIETHLDGRRERLPPHDLVGVMLVRSDEYHGTLLIERLAKTLAVDLAIRHIHDVEQLLSRRWGQRNAAPVAPVPTATMRPSGPAFTESLIAISASCSSCVMLRPVMSSSVWVFA